MANVARPQGARPKGVAERANRYVSGGAVYPGDLVLLDSSGRAVAASAASALCGASASYASAAGQDILVYDDPNQQFIIEASGSEIDAQTDINLNYDIVASAPSSAYKMSRMRLDSSTGGTSATLPLKLLDVERRPDNALGANVDCVVKINNHQLSGGTGTAGV